MNGGQRIEQFRLHNLQPRAEQFGTNHQRHRATDEKHEKRKPKIHAADIFVVGGGENARPRPFVIVMIMRMIGAERVIMW